MNAKIASAIERDIRAVMPRVARTPHPRNRTKIALDRARYFRVHRTDFRAKRDCSQSYLDLKLKLDIVKENTKIKC